MEKIAELKARMRTEEGKIIHDIDFGDGIRCRMTSDFKSEDNGEIDILIEGTDKEKCLELLKGVKT